MMVTVLTFNNVKCLPTNASIDDIERVTDNPVEITSATDVLLTTTAAMINYNSGYTNTSTTEVQHEEIDEYPQESIVYVFFDNRYLHFGHFLGAMMPPSVIIAIPCNEGYTLVKGICRRSYTT